MSTYQNGYYMTMKTAGLAKAAGENWDNYTLPERAVLTMAPGGRKLTS